MVCLLEKFQNLKKIKLYNIDLLSYKTDNIKYNTESYKKVYPNIILKLTSKFLT